MNFEQLDTDPDRWTGNTYQRARDGVAARALHPKCPQTGDIVIHPDGQRSRLWIDTYAGTVACTEDPDYGFILETDGTSTYTGTETMYHNHPIELANLRDGQHTEGAVFWVNRRDEDRSCDVVDIKIDVQVWYTTDMLGDEQPYRALESEYWIDAARHRTRAALDARNALPVRPRSGDIIVHPDGRRSRLWIDEDGDAYACGADSDYGFVLDTDGFATYTGDPDAEGNTPITLAGLVDAETTIDEEFWIDHILDDRPAATLHLLTATRQWNTVEPAGELTYGVVADRIHSDESWDTEITEQEAKIIASAWASDTWLPDLCAWAEGKLELNSAQILTDADELVENLSSNNMSWPYAGEPWPSIAAANALLRFLEGPDKDADRPDIACTEG